VSDVESYRAPGSAGLARRDTTNLADVLERILDKGVVIAGDIVINVVDIELLSIKLRLLVASVDKAREMGIDWWEHDPALSSRASADGQGELHERIERLEERLRALGPGEPDRDGASAGGRRSG
jgi:hypothetical protein